MSFLKVVIFGYPLFKFQGSKKLLGDTTLSRAGFSTKMKSAYLGRNRAWIHKSQKSLYSWKKSYWEVFVVTSLGGGNSNIFYFHPDPWGNDPIWRAWFFGMGTGHVGFADAEMRLGYQLPAISRLLLSCNPHGAGERRKCVTCTGFFSWNANGEWTEVMADPEQRKRDSFVLFLKNSLGVFFGENLN